VPEVTFQQAYPLALRAAEVRASAAVLSGVAQVSDRDDLQQEGLTACWRALPHFDPNRASLRTFIERVVASRLASSVRRARRTSPPEPLKAASQEAAGSGSGELDLSVDVRRIASSLSFAERQLILVLLDHSPAEASRLLGIPRSTVHDRIVRLRRHFVAAGYTPMHTARSGAAR
jgi:RNA polymerase sigma factor (sigma-70 family)